MLNISYIKNLYYRVVDIFRRKDASIAEKEQIYSSVKKITLVGNSPCINEQTLPRSDLVICNHFWRHKHYATIKSGFHVISDTNFTKALDIHQFIQNNNKNIIIVCSNQVRHFLLANGLKNTVVLGCNYSGSWPLWSYGVRQSRIQKICQTGSTVIADLGLPLAYFLSVEELKIIGVTLNYGQNLRDYAFPVHNSILAPDDYMRKHFKHRASKSINAWCQFLSQKGVVVEWH